MSRASLDKDPHEVAAMFDGVADGYDRANSFMTFGFDRRWRTTTARVLDARRGEKVLDLAARPGVSTVEYARGGAWRLAADFSFRLLSAGWTDVEWLNLTFGVVAIHRARKPA